MATYTCTAKCFTAGRLWNVGEIMSAPGDRDIPYFQKLKGLDERDALKAGAKKVLPKDAVTFSEMAKGKATKTTGEDGFLGDEGKAKK